MARKIRIGWMCLLLAGTIRAAAPTAGENAGTLNGDELRDAMSQLAALVQAGITNAPDVVSVNSLRSLLPDELIGMRRKSIAGEKIGAFGVALSYSEAVYQDADRGWVTVKVTDMGGLRSLATMAQSAWRNTELHFESDQGFERTFRYKKHQAYERYESTARNGRFQMVAHDRYLIEIDGRGVPFERIVEARDAIDLDVLAALAPLAKTPSEESAGTEP